MSQQRVSNKRLAFGRHTPLFIEAALRATTLDPSEYHMYEPAVIKAMAGKEGSLLDRAIVENVNVQKLALQTKPSLVKKMYAAKKIDIVGAVYDLATGKVSLV